jgi:hypothetical protein
MRLGIEYKHGMPARLKKRLKCNRLNYKIVERRNGAYDITVLMRRKATSQSRNKTVELKSCRPQNLLKRSIRRAPHVSIFHKSIAKTDSLTAI